MAVQAQPLPLEIGGGGIYRRENRTIYSSFLVGGKITISRHKAVHTFLDNMFRSVSLQVQMSMSLDLKRNGSKHVQKCMYRFVSVDIQAFFTLTPQKARALQAQLVSCTDVSALMHTPLLATLMCRLFQLNTALPSTQTGVYMDVKPLSLIPPVSPKILRLR